MCPTSPATWPLPILGSLSIRMPSGGDKHSHLVSCGGSGLDLRSSLPYVTISTYRAFPSMYLKNISQLGNFSSLFVFARASVVGEMISCLIWEEGKSRRSTCRRIFEYIACTGCRCGGDLSGRQGRGVPDAHQNGPEDYVRVETRSQAGSGE